MTDDQPFSRRMGYRPAESDITIREDAPDEMRHAIVMLADSLGLDPDDTRSEVCRILLKIPKNSNWTLYPNIFNEVNDLVAEAPWFRVYDIAEGFYDRLESSYPPRGQEFQERLNEFFREKGIGWEMQDGRIVVRGSGLCAGCFDGAGRDEGVRPQYCGERNSRSLA